MGLGIGGSKNKSKNTSSSTIDQTAVSEMSNRGYDAIMRQIGSLSGMDYQAFDPASIATFLNPATQQVTDASLAQINAAGDEARAQRQSDMAGAGAFGNDRRGIYDAQLDADVDRQRAELIAGLNQSNYNNALSAAMTENAARNSQQLDIAGLISQLLGGTVGQEGTMRTTGRQTGTSTSKGSQIGFSWASGR